MSKHKWNYEVTDLDALEKAYSKAVETEKKPVRAVITKLLECGVEVPGIKVITESPSKPADEQATEPEPNKEQVPGFLGKKPA